MPKSMLAIAFLLSAVGLAQNQQIAAGPVYDNFKGSFLDASKWLAVPTCSASVFVNTTDSVNPLDCAREIQDHNLRLLVKAYGKMDSDVGRQFGPSELYFANPNAVTSITTSLTVERVDAVACPSNTTDSFGQAIFGGNYFNPGTGDPKDDVAAIIIVQHSASSPDRVLGVYALVFSPNAFYGFLTLGAIDFDERLAAKVQWDQPNHRFLFSASGEGIRSTGTIPYNASDGMPPAAPMKLLAGRAFVPNCTTQQTAAYIEVLFDNVMTN